MMSAKGRLLLIVGPSGAGKDTLIDGLRCAAGEEEGFIFPVRFITRPAGAGGEAHQAVTMEQFGKMRAAGRFAFHWRAHGLSYAIPSTIDDDLEKGRVVVINVSRAIIRETLRRYPRTRVINVTIKPEILQRRLRGRGRESEAEIQERMERSRMFALGGENITEFANNLSIEEGREEFVSLVRKLTAG